MQKRNLLIKTINKAFFLRLSLYFVLFVTLPITGFAQVDSLRDIINSSKNASEIARNYNLLADQFLDIDAELSRMYADSAKLLGEKIFDFKIISDSYVNYANSYFFKGNLDSALFYFERSYHTILRTRNNNEIAASLNRLGLIYESKSDYSKAAEYYYKALKIYEETQHLKGIAEIYNNIGVINDAMGQVDEAIINYRKSLLQFENANFIEGQANVYNNLATHYANKNQLDTAIIYINSAISILEEKNRNTEVATAYLNASSFYDMMGYADTALIYMDSALVKYSKTNNIHGIANVYNQQAKTLFLNNDFEGAISLLTKSLDLRREVGNLTAESLTLNQLSDYYFESGDYYNALKYYKDHIYLRDSIFDSRTKTMISKLSIEYETEKKDKEITILRNEAEIKRSHNRLLVFLSVSLAVISVLLFYFFRIKTSLLSSQKKYFEQQERLNKLELEKQETERELLEKEVKTQQQINELQKKRFQAELDHSKRELVTTTMQVLNKNKTLNEIKEYLVDLEPRTQEESRSYRELSKMISDNINLDSDWDQLKIHFEKVNTGFFEKLQELYPELSQGDLKVCAYIKIKLSSKEIAHMMNISPAGINKRLYRIRRKMKLPVHSNIAEYLDKI